MPGLQSPFRSSHILKSNKRPVVLQQCQREQGLITALEPPCKESKPPVVVSGDAHSGGVWAQPLGPAALHSQQECEIY